MKKAILRTSAVSIILFLSFLLTACSDTIAVTSGNSLPNDTRLGSTNYVNHIMDLSVKSGSRYALSVVMNDVDGNGRDLDQNDPNNILRFYRLVSHLVQQTGSVDRQTHYFRNKLNRAPASLKDMIDLNRRLPINRRWVLLSVLNSAYHLQGPDGEYNLKFLSSDGFCEAVYNKKGILLTEKNDPVNMGTFNYAAGIKAVNAHEKYDIAPYLTWGNTPDSPQKGAAVINRGLYSALIQYQTNATGVYVYRKDLFGMEQGRVP